MAETAAAPNTPIDTTPEFSTEELALWEYAKNPKVATAPFDARFPNTNQTKNCWQNYVDYFKCVRAKGSDFAPCKRFQKTYFSLCPPLWLDRWDEQRENNVFPALHEPAHHDGDHH